MLSRRTDRKGYHDTMHMVNVLSPDWVAGGSSACSPPTALSTREKGVAYLVHVVA